MKKTVMLILCLVLLISFEISAYAAGQDDGRIFVVTEGEKTYFGRSVSDFCTHYIAADGSGDEFYRWKIDLNGDNEMNICDLVKTKINGTDVNSDGKYDASDLQLLRKILIGIKVY